MPAARGYDVDRHPSIEKGGFVTTAQIMEAQSGKPQLPRSSDEASCNGVRIARAGQFRGGAV
jgi:hypothetical protein